MLMRLGEANPYSCKECGMRFISGEKLGEHRTEHLKEKLGRIEGEGGKERGCMLG
jgi:hypothetical protein